MLPIDVIAAVMYCMLARPTGMHAATHVDPVLMWAHMGLAVVCGFLVISLAIRLLALHFSTQTHLPGRLSSSIRLVTSGVRGVCLLLFVFELNVIGWPGPWMADWRDKSDLLQSLIGIAPFILQVTLAWVSLRQLEELVHPQRWSVAHFVWFRFQYTFFILIPWVCLWGLVDVMRWVYPEASSKGDWLDPETVATWVTLLGTILVMAIYPAVLVRFWQCRRLPDGRLRDALNQLQERAGVRFNEMYVWGMGAGKHLNAAALGYVPPFRYMLISDGLLDRLTEEEVLAVAAHELGHLRHRHMIWYLLVTMAFMFLFEWMAGYFLSPHLQVLIFCTLFAVYLRVVFGFISRRFERQADLTSVELMGGAGPLTTGLEKIAWFSGQIRSAKCWHHRSIETRVAYIRDAASEPSMRHRHHADVARLKRIILAGGSLLLVLMVWQMYVDSTMPRGASLVVKHVTEKVSPELHWLEVLHVVPDDPDAPAALVEAMLDAVAKKVPVTTKRIADLMPEGAAPVAPDASGTSVDSDVPSASSGKWQSIARKEIATWLKVAESRADTDARAFRCRMLRTRLARVFPPQDGGS